MKTIIYAPNVHVGGGKSLLLGLLAAVGNEEATVFLDERLGRPDSLASSVRVRSVKPNVQDRLKAELELFKVTEQGDLVFCFGNLPPLIPSKGNVSVYLQNRYLLQRRRTQGLKLKHRLRIEIERIWLRLFLRKSELIVQTTSMAREAVSVFDNNRVRVIPFIAYDGIKPEFTNNLGSPCCLIYVASSEPHKNHRNLVGAWELLAHEGLFPKLYLTLDRESDLNLIRWIESQRSAFSLDIQFTGVLPKKDLAALYQKCDALIYPSLFESFGLPLIEAEQYGLPLIAAELDYVRDVCSPLHTFDPGSPISIARAVKRFLGIHNRPHFYSPAAFIKEILRGNHDS